MSQWWTGSQLAVLLDPSVRSKCSRQQDVDPPVLEGSHEDAEPWNFLGVGGRATDPGVAHLSIVLPV